MIKLALIFTFILASSLQAKGIHILQSHAEAIDALRRQVATSLQREKLDEVNNKLLDGRSARISKRGASDEERVIAQESIIRTAILDAFKGYNDFHDHYHTNALYGDADHYHRHLMAIAHVYHWARFCIETAQQHTIQSLDHLQSLLRWDLYELYAQSHVALRDTRQSTIFSQYFLNQGMKAWLMGSSMLTSFIKLNDKHFKDVMWDKEASGVSLPLPTSAVPSVKDQISYYQAIYEPYMKQPPEGFDPMKTYLPELITPICWGMAHAEEVIKSDSKHHVQYFRDLWKNIQENIQQKNLSLIKLININYLLSQLIPENDPEMHSIGRGCFYFYSFEEALNNQSLIFRSYLKITWPLCFFGVIFTPDGDFKLEEMERLYFEKDFPIFPLGLAHDIPEESSHQGEFWLRSGEFYDHDFSHAASIYLSALKLSLSKEETIEGWYQYRKFFRNVLRQNNDFLRYIAFTLYHEMGIKKFSSIFNIGEYLSLVRKAFPHIERAFILEEWKENQISLWKYIFKERTKLELDLIQDYFNKETNSIELLCNINITHDLIAQILVKIQYSHILVLSNKRVYPYAEKSELKEISFPERLYLDEEKIQEFKQLIESRFKNFFSISSTIERSLYCRNADIFFMVQKALELEVQKTTEKNFLEFSDLYLKTIDQFEKRVEELGLAS